MKELRNNLVKVALDWELAFGNAPSITSAISEFDAAMLIGCSEEEYSEIMQGVTAVQKGYDFRYKESRYQVKANRPSGKRGSKVTLVPKAKNYDWDFLIWVLYTREYQIEGAWLWNVAEYRNSFHELSRLSPTDYKKGMPLA